MNNGGRSDEPMVCDGSWIGPDGGRRSESVWQLWRPVSGCRRCRVDQCGAQFIPTKIIVFPTPVGMDSLLRILNAYPESLKIIRKKERAVKSSAQVVYIEEAGNKSFYQFSYRPFSSEIEDIGYGS